MGRVVRAVARAGMAVALLVFALWAFIVIRAAWTLASQPAARTDIAITQGELLASAMSLVLQPLLFVATAVTARATMNTVREMRDARDQEARLEDARRADHHRQAVRDDAWLLIGHVYAIAGIVGAVGGVLATARFGRLRRSVEEPVLRKALLALDRTAEAVAAAERLIDKPGPWRAPAERLRDLAVELSGQLAEPRHAQALAADVPDALKALRSALPDVGGAG